MKRNHSFNVFASSWVWRHATGSWKRQSGLKEGPFVLVICATVLLEVDGVAVNRHRRLHHSLAQRRVGVDVAAELPSVALEELGQGWLGDELSRLAAADVLAEHLARLGGRDDLHEAAVLAVHLLA